MYNLEERVNAYRAKGLSCSQVLMSVVGLDPQGREDGDLVKAMDGLTCGMYCRHTCGALAGAACAMALYGAPREDLSAWCRELSAWFEERFGAVTCERLLGGEARNPALCADIIRETAEEALEILEEAGVL